MGQRRQKRHHLTTKSHTLPSSPTHSSSSSDFEFTISGASPRKSSGAAADLCPADDIFYKGQLLPLHISPRLSMVRTLLLSSASTSSSSDTTTTASRDSTDSSSSSGRPSSVTDDEFKRLTNTTPIRKPSSKYFSLPKLSSVFRKEQKNPTPPPSSGGAAAVKRVSSTAKEVIRRYLKKVKPIYEKLSQKQQQKVSPPPEAAPPPFFRSENSSTNNNILHSFSGNLRSPRGRRSYISSCPSSMRSSPSHGKTGFGFSQTGRAGNSDSSSMEELQNAIQGAIAHCKNSMLQNKTMVVSNEI
ncbi:hypothetical protein DH2020_043588 [Rehmannia glutinosa]|uniref:Membrane-associated kinase regulator 1 n=1 Tax=Rehmannia glutinosa TaxID=99300 RepID=A0ABR0UJE6_REHGL